VKLPKLLPASPTEPSLEGRAFVFSAFAVAVLSIVLYGQEYLIPAVGLALAAAGHVVSYRGRDKPRTFWGQALVGALILAALAYFLADSVAALFGGVLPQANFAVLLVAVTSFDLKTRRNLYSSLWISLAILYLAAVYAWDYPFGVLVALWAVCLAGFWACSNLRRMGARVAAPPRAVAGMVIGALAFGLAAFVFIPQPAFDPTGPLVVSLPSYASFKGEMESPALPLVQVGGDSTTIDLHFRGRLGDAPVMYVRTGAPAYWRGLVFDTYKDGAWTASRKGFVAQFPPYIPPHLLAPAPLHAAGTFVQVFRIARTLPGVLNAAYPIQSLYAPVTALRQDAYGTFRTPDVLRAGMTYSVVSWIPNLSAKELQQDDWASGEPEGIHAYVDTGSLSLGAKRLALEVAQTAAASNDTFTQYDLVMALTTYLQKHYRYTLEIGHVPPGRDPVDWFLFDVKLGYCEQFATAEVMMLRSLGIPARLATGYATGDYNPILNQAIVRERDAHAWVEVWFANHGWVPFDPTPGVSGLAATRFPSHWAGGGLARLIPHLSVGAPAAALGSLGFLGIVGPAIATVAITTMLWIWLRSRRRRAGIAGPELLPGESELLRLYEQLQSRLGRRRAPPETPLEYLTNLLPQPLSPPPPGRGPGWGDAGLRSVLEETTHAVNEGAYAGRWPEPTKVRELSDRLK
jgi:transglutaminase-like putative cysteine protease